MQELLDEKPPEWWVEKAEKWTAGANLGEALACVKRLNAVGYRVVINSIAEPSLTKEAIASMKDNYLALIDIISKHKLNAGITVRLTNLGITAVYEDAKSALITVLKKSEQDKVLVEVDMEERPVVENTVKLIAEALREKCSVRLCIQSALKDASKHVTHLLGVAKESGAKLSFRIVTGSCYKETLELGFPETAKQFYKLMLLCGKGSAIGTHVTERLLCAKALNMETQVLKGFEDKQPPKAVDTIYACFGDWRTNKGIRGYILRREKPQ